MGNLLEETPVTFTALAKREGVNVSTVWRWAGKGVKSHVLESYNRGGKRFTTEEAYVRWVVAQNAGTVQAPSTAKQRERAIAQAEKELAEMGV